MVEKNLSHEEIFYDLELSLREARDCGADHYEEQTWESRYHEVELSQASG